MKRPECFEFAMSLVGDPEESEIREYVRLLEKKSLDLNGINLVLLRQIGDSRCCPHCSNSFIPSDSTSNEALTLWNKLKII